MRGYSSAYYQAHKQRVNAANSRWKARNPVKVAAAKVLWAKNNPEKTRLSRLKSNARIEARFDVLKRMSLKRGIALDLSFAEYVQIVSGAVCFHCKGALPVQGHGIDRLDNRRSYAADNCAACCGWCNKVKGHLEAAGFTHSRTIELLRERIAELAQLARV